MLTKPSHDKARAYGSHERECGDDGSTTGHVPDWQEPELTTGVSR